MKALILSGGTGSRLRPLTFTGAKQLIPVANKPILFYAIETVLDAGIRDIGIILGDTAKEVRSAVGDGSAWGVNITYIQQDAPKGLAHAVEIAEDFIGDDPFLMFLGDNIVKGSIQPYVETFQNHTCEALVLLSEVQDPTQFGVARLDGNRIVELIEKPSVPPSRLAVIGIYLFRSAIFKAVHKIQPSWRNELEITDAIQYLIASGAAVEQCTIDNWWKDTGKPEDVLDANRVLLESMERRIEGTVDNVSLIEGRVVIEKGATVKNSVIRGPAVIGRDSRIVNAYVGPFTSIYSNVCIENSEIENSIVLESTVASNISRRIDSSLIGRNATICETQSRPSTCRFLVGEQSHVSIG